MTNQWAGFCITVTALALCGVLRLTCEHSEGFVEAELMSNMAHYARDQNYPNGYEFGKAMEHLAFEVWKALNEKHSDEVPF